MQDEANQEPPPAESIQETPQPTFSPNQIKQIKNALSNNGFKSFQTKFGTVLLHNADENSVMIAFRISDVLRDELQEKYPFMSDETKDELHITLAYLGDARTLDLRKVGFALAYFMEIAEPIKTTLQGIARFVSGNDEDPIVITVDSPDFPEFRQKLTQALDRFKIPYHKEHGFIPHMTLAYIPKDDKMPVDTVEQLEMNFSDVYLVVGSEWKKFELDGEPEYRGANL